MFTNVVRILIAASLLGSAALAQRVEISPQAIVVNPLPSFDVDVWVDRAPGRDGLHRAASQPGLRDREPQSIVRAVRTVQSHDDQLIRHDDVLS